MRCLRAFAVAAAVLSLGAGAHMAWGSEGEQPPPPAGRVMPSASARALGGSAANSSFVSMTPCRLVDTRLAGGAFADDAARKFDVRGTGATFAAQGGKSGGCGIPASGVTAVEITVTAVSATGTGFVRVYPGAEPTATFLNYATTINASNTGPAALCLLCASNQDITVRNRGSATHVVIDVTGFYQPPMVAMVNEFGVLEKGSRVASTAKLGGTGQYEVVFDRDISTCAWFGGPSDTSIGSPIGEVVVSERGGNANGVFVAIYNAQGTALKDSEFTVSVIC